MIHVRDRRQIRKGRLSRFKQLTMLGFWYSTGISTNERVYVLNGRTGGWFTVRDSYFRNEFFEAKYPAN